jgi:hypothetical protein
MRVALIAVALIAFCPAVHAACYTNLRGKLICGNGEAAAGYNPHTGTTWKSETGQYGVRTTQTNRGGEAKTKNGKGVYKSPNGTTCYKGANSHGCN